MKKLLSAVALAVSAVAANAATTTVLVDTIVTDTYSFNAGAGAFDATISAPFALYDITSVSLGSTLLNSQTFGQTEYWTIHLDNLAAGPYTLTIAGGLTTAGNALKALNVYTASATGSFTYTAAAPVPEPETYAMMLAGLGAVGFMARRRKAQ